MSVLPKEAREVVVPTATAEAKRPAVSSIMTTAQGTNMGAFTALDWVLFLSIGCIWGSSFLLMDIGLDAFDPGVITWLRVTAGACILACMPQARAPVARADWPRLVVLSVLWVALPFTLFPIAQQHINSATTGMLNGAVPIVAAPVQAAMLRRLPGRMQAAGIVVGFCGVVLVSVPTAGEGGTSALGVALVLVATVCYGISVNIAAPIQQAYGSLRVMARMLALASLWTVTYAAIGLSSSHFAWAPFAAVLAAGVIGTGVAYALMGALVGRVGSARASLITYIIPVVALLLGVSFRGDAVEPVAVVGVALIIVGAFFASRKESGSGTQSSAVHGNSGSEQTQ